MSTDVEQLLEAAVDALGGTHREGQTTMAQAVSSALDNQTHLLVQAGTGTGKSLGYLVPSVEYALRTGDRVIISTATLALQSQIIQRDLPRLAKTVGSVTGRKPTSAVLKGRRNYVCLHKLGGGYPGDEDSALFDVGADIEGRRGGSMTATESEIARIREWADATTTGDRDDLVPGVSDRTWSLVSVNSFDCLGSTCPMFEECFAERAKNTAADADIVVTNHALLAIEAQGEQTVLPEHSAVVIDEAHELRDRVTGALTGAVTHTLLSAVASTVKKHTAATADAIQALTKASDQFAAALEEHDPGLLRVWPDDLGDALSAVHDALRDLSSQVGGTSKESEPDAGRHMARARIDEALELVERLLDRNSNDVAWISTNTFKETTTTSLMVAPLSVAGTLRNGLFAESTVVATSATLALGGKFEPVAAALGLAGEEAPRYDAIDVGSPFDYQKQGILYVAGHLPKPGRFGVNVQVLDEIVELIEASRGGALGLFSSRRAAEEAAQYVRERTRYQVYLQGEDTLSVLVKDFAADDSAVLFGTMSLWQGVDVPGLTNRLVIIDRIPFPRPDDPLSQARTQAAAARGANGFMAVSATHAALRLAQGAGRLIRTSQDRGVVALLDSRARTASYSKFLLDSLPPLWPTTNSGVVKQALERLATGALATGTAKTATGEAGAEGTDVAAGKTGEDSTRDE